MANPAISTWSAPAGRRLFDRVQMDLMVHRVKTPGLTVIQQQATGFVLRDGAHGRAQFLPVNQVGGFLQIPIYMMEWSSVSNPLSWFLWGSRIGAWGLDWLAQVDHNDLLGVSEITWDWNDLPANMATRYKRGNWKGGKRGVNAYIYSFGYQIKVKDVSK